MRGWVPVLRRFIDWLPLCHVWEDKAPYTQSVACTQHAHTAQTYITWPWQRLAQCAGDLSSAWGWWSMWSVIQILSPSDAVIHVVYIYIFTTNLSKLDRNIFRVLPVDDKNVSNALLVQDKSSLCCLQGLFLIATACYLRQKMFLWLHDLKYNKSVRENDWK